MKKTALSEIAADWDKGQAFKKECIVNEGNTPCIHYGELFKYGSIIDTILSWTNESPIKSSAKGDILFPASDVTPNGLARCSALMSEGVLLGGDIIVLRLKSGFIPEFVSYAINMQKDQLIRRVTGSVVRHMSAKSLNSVEIPIPAIADQKQFIDIIRQADKSKFSDFKSRFIEMQRTSDYQNELGDFIERCVPERCGDRELPVLSVTKEYAMVHQSERFEATVVSRDKSNYIVAPRGYLVQGIHIDESNFGIQNLVDEGIVSPAYKLWRFKNQDCIPELIEYYLRSEMAIKYFKRHFLGSTVPRRQVIKKDDFLSMPLNLPEKRIQERYFAFFQQADKSKYLN